jgi:hypothetical protein
MDAADHLALHELPGRSGDCIDGRNWEGLRHCFTEDAVFDLTDLGGPTLQGLAEIQRFMADEAQHPLTHLMTNIYVDETSNGVQLHSRILAILEDRRAGSGSYLDDVVQTPDGWRIKHRVFTLMRRPKSAA